MLYTRTPQVRAAHLKALVAALEALGAARAAGARAAVPPWIMRRIDAATRLEWLPADYLVSVCEAVERCGAEALRAWGAASLEVIFRAPLVRAAYELAMAFGRHRPAVMLSYLARAWPLLYQGCGDLVVVEASPTAMDIVHAPVPELLRREAAVLPLVGAFEAIPLRCGVASARGRADWATGTERFVYAIEWGA